MKRGYHLIDFTGQLKSLLSTALGAVGTHVSVYEIATNKKKYRSLLQEFSVAIGYRTDPKYVDALLAQWFPGEPAVFDNVRDPAQWQVLKEAGFKLVMLHVPGGEQRKRAGADIGVLESMRAHPVEFPLDFSLVDLHITTTTPVEEIARQLISWGV